MIATEKGKGETGRRRGEREIERREFRSVKSLDQLGSTGGDMMDHSAEILFQSFLRDAIVNSDGSFLSLSKCNVAV